ncbi:uncharacterized protein LOC115626619 isoform X2 [Scaptodrosophila lebanonensis]|uniref:Uncharacterized protein LOC115626619 isoform X2 n=1 Tax=Drosophila lebanonensis TaxID=7225 RepID=A0A6J2TPA3_DROLE|nr:uncharacterized protein LOC115626619 isoform X2 [Scaptodrosophila lebanonensis]
MVKGVCRNPKDVKESEVNVCKKGLVTHSGLCQTIERIRKGDKCLPDEIKVAGGHCHKKNNSDDYSIFHFPPICPPGYVLTPGYRCRRRARTDINVLKTKQMPEYC